MAQATLQREQAMSDGGERNAAFRMVSLMQAAVSEVVVLGHSLAQQRCGINLLCIKCFNRAELNTEGASWRKCHNKAITSTDSPWGTVTLSWHPVRYSLEALCLVRGSQAPA